MKRMQQLGAGLALGALMIAALLVTPASATTSGSWYSNTQSGGTTTTTTATSTAYKSAVRPPINADGSSNFPSKRGVIPVQFDLMAAPSTTTTTTTSYPAPVWDSVASGGKAFSYAGLNLGASSTTRFSDITNLSATYAFTTGDCFGGSLRWDIRVVHNGMPQTVHVYYGTPNGPDQGCSGVNSGSNQNLITTGITADRFEMQGGWGVAGPVYTTYTDALASTNNGADIVTSVQLTLDSGWKADQRADVSNVTVNDNTWVPNTTTSNSTTVTGAYEKTCSLPSAELRWAKNDATPTGAINEADSVQPKDTGQYYRQVDCKYIYNLDVSSLSGQGTYTVWVVIDGTKIPVPATFDVR